MVVVNVGGTKIRSMNHTSFTLLLIFTIRIKEAVQLGQPLS